MEVLPVWLQWAEALATILSSVGVLVALLQLKVSGDQARKQLQLAEKQFNLINQGFLQTTFNADFLKTNEQIFQQGDLLYPDTLYNSIFPVVKVENVGNLPLFFFFESFTVAMNGAACYQTSPDIFEGVDNLLFPKQSIPLMLGRVYFNAGLSGLTFAQVQDLRLTCRLRITYRGFNDENGAKKVIDHQMELSGVFFIYKKNTPNDKSITS